jgi:multidrug transporter EmrE-like cation transporter
MGGICGKYAATTLSTITLVSILTNPFYLLALGFLFLQAIVWQQALIYFPLSIAYPCISVTNFVVLFSAAALFHENITYANIIGLILVTAGIFLLFYLYEELP